MELRPLLAMNRLVPLRRIGPFVALLSSKSYVSVAASVLPDGKLRQGCTFE